MKHAVIYIPGLGDARVAGQRWAVAAWKIYGIEPHLFVMHWNDGEAFAPKLERLLACIDQLVAAGKTVSLVSASAGSSAALTAFAARQEHISGVACICGKLQGYESVQPVTYRKNPAFGQAMQQLPASHKLLGSEARKRIVSLHALADESVPIADTKLPGAQSRSMPVVGHFWGIAYGLTLGSFGILRFLAELAKSTGRT
jgi:hypothetical protein